MTKARFLIAVLFIAPALLPGQDKTIGALIYPGPVFTEIKQYLGLTDAQMQSLQTIQDSRSQASQNVYNQISQKNQALYQLLNSDSGSAAQLGQFLLDIRNLEKQLPLVDGPYKSQSLNVLTADQKTKLPKLSEALQLQNTAAQAGMLLLIDYPQYSGPPRIFTGVTPAGVTVAGVAAVGLPQPAPPLYAPPLANR